MLVLFFKTCIENHRIFLVTRKNLGVGGWGLENPYGVRIYIRWKLLEDPLVLSSCLKSDSLYNIFFWLGVLKRSQKLYNYVQAPMSSISIHPFTKITHSLTYFLILNGIDFSHMNFVFLKEHWCYLNKIQNIETP